MTPRFVPTAKQTPSADNSEEARSFLQTRVALFWKVMFFIVLSSSGIGLIENALGQQFGPGQWFNTAATLLAGTFWWQCRRGERSVRFCRFMEAEALLAHGVLGILLVRYSAGQFLAERSIDTAEGTLMADGLFLMMAQGGSAMLVAIRAALIPSQPRRTAWVTALYGIPTVLATTVLAPVQGEALALRQLGSEALPWLPGMSLMMWAYATITCTVISSVIYGLRQEVRRARLLGQYVLGRKLGEGGLGEVFVARHGLMRRPSAIKLLKAGQSSEANLRRFEQEVQLTSRLTHPNTITIFDYGRTAENVFYYAMELLDGATLQNVVEASGPQSPGRVVRMLTMACGALSEAHDAGLVHRDIKPANIMLCSQGGELDVVKLLDFGLVKDTAVKKEVELTQAGTITGTPRYMAPESILDAAATDARSDLYALGAVAYFLLAGTELFDGKSVVEICGQHLHQPPTPLSTHGVEVPAALEQLVMECLDKDPAQRPQSAVELRQRLVDCSVEAWSGEDARRWWNKYGEQLRGSTEEEEEALKRTLAVHREK